jgi:hypothetical protein
VEPFHDLHQLGALARANPVLAIYEDAHWIDPTSRELLDLMVDRVHVAGAPAANVAAGGITRLYSWTREDELCSYQAALSSFINSASVVKGTSSTCTTSVLFDPLTTISFANRPLNLPVTVYGVVPDVSGPVHPITETAKPPTKVRSCLAVSTHFRSDDVS